MGNDCSWTNQEWGGKESNTYLGRKIDDVLSEILPGISIDLECEGIIDLKKESNYFYQIRKKPYDLTKEIKGAFSLSNLKYWVNFGYDEQGVILFIEILQRD